MKVFFSIVLLVFTNAFLIAQDQHQVFTFKVTQGFVDSEYQLDVYKNFSIWQQKVTPTLNSATPFSGELKISKQKLYKDYLNNNIYTGYHILQTNYSLKDDLKLMDWKMTDETSEILGYSCQAAKTHFRGRDYVAYFTTEIPVSEGPFKFNGLPGMILKVSNVDPKERKISNSKDTYNWECIDINFSARTNLNALQKQQNLLNDYNSFITKTWSELKTDIQLSVEESKDNMREVLKDKARKGMKITYTMENAPEVFHSELQTKGISIQF